MYIVMFCIYKTQQGSHCETVEQWDSRLLLLVCGAVWRIPTFLWISVFCSWRLLHWHVDIPAQNVTFCASQQLLFLLTNEMTCSTFLYSTVNMLCGSMNRLLTVWQCTEILLYSNRWGFVNWYKSNCSQIFAPPPVHHHLHIFSRSTNCIAQRQNLCKTYTTLYTLYMPKYIYDYISLGSS